MSRRRNEQVILYSTTLHCWEVWHESRPLGHGTLEACQYAYPDALPVAESQLRLAHEDASRTATSLA